MKPRTLHELVAVAAWLALGIGNALAAEPSAVLALREGGELSCEPTLPYFCENMHVSCAGRTQVSTFPFKLRHVPGGSSVALRSDDEESQSKYADGLLVWAEDGSSLLYSPRDANGYIKLLANGKYALRHYIGGRGIMSLGQCK